VCFALRCSESGSGSGRSFARWLEDRHSDWHRNSQSIQEWQRKKSAETVRQRREDAQVAVVDVLMTKVKAMVASAQHYNALHRVGGVGRSEGPRSSGAASPCGHKRIGDKVASEGVKVNLPPSAPLDIAGPFRCALLCKAWRLCGSTRVPDLPRCKPPSAILSLSLSLSPYLPFHRSSPLHAS
jgi:hypothetical protein